MSSTPRRRKKLAPGIWQDAHGISVVVRVADRYEEPRYPLGSSVKYLKEERDALRTKLREEVKRGRAAKGSFGADVVEYLKAVAALTTKRERTFHLQYWTALWGNRPRHEIQAHEVQAQRDALLVKGKAASTVSHYLRALSNLYTVLDGRRGYNPVRDVAEPEEPEEVPRAIPPQLAETIIGKVQGVKTHARLLVLVTSGLPQGTFRHIAPADVDFDAATIRLPKRMKGQRAAARVLPLTPAGVRAWRAVASADAWGRYSTSSVWKSFKRACAAVERAHNADAPPTKRIDLSDLRPYDLRHTFGTELSRATGGNVQTIGHMLGHAGTTMAERYRAAAVPEHLRAAAAALGRLQQSAKRGATTSNRTSNRAAGKGGFRRSHVG